jgi:hypothetical protein
MKSKSETDAMPAEVATELLAAPRAKMTNRFRKTCRAARAHFWSSATPLVRADGGDFEATANKAKSWAIRSSARAAGATLRQLRNWERRARAQARTHLRRAIKADGTESISAPQRRALARLLTEWADMCADTAAARGAK